jgi:hypothetical protein
MPTLPTRFFTFTIGEPARSLDEDALHKLKEAHRVWLLSSAFSDFVRAVSAALQEAIAYIEVATTFQPGTTTVADFNSWRESTRKRVVKAQKGDLPTLLDTVEKGLSSPLTLREQVLSINKVRNCLEHRHGIVTEADLTDKAAQVLQLGWRRMRIFYEKDGAEVAVEPLVPIVGPADVKSKLEDVTKEWKLGDTIDLTVDEFNEAMFTCLLLGNEIVSKLPQVQTAPRNDDPAGGDAGSLV